ncbi:MAG: hypothetical protein ABI268_03045 [Rhodanobacter sp.]
MPLANGRLAQQRPHESDPDCCGQWPDAATIAPPFDRLDGPDVEINVVNSIAAAKVLPNENAGGLPVIDIGLPDGSGIELISWRRNTARM